MFDGEMDCGRLWMEDTGCACFLWTGTTVTCLRVLYDDDCDENIAGDAMDCDNADDEEAITKKLSSYSSSLLCCSWCAAAAAAASSSRASCWTIFRTSL